MAAYHNTARRKKQKNFLQAFAESGNITQAAKAAKIDRKLHYFWLQEDPEYPEKFKDAQDQAVDVLEAEARRRAVEGVGKAVGWHQGEPGGYERQYSDTMLIFLLKGARPEKYRERYEVTGANGEPLKVQFYLPSNGRDDSSSSDDNDST